MSIKAVIMVDVDAELEALEGKVNQLNNLVNDYEGDDGHARSISLKILMLQRRLGRITSREDIRDRVAMLSAQLTEIESKFQVLEEAVGLIPHPPDPVVPRHEMSVSRKHVPVCKWGLHFSGEENDVSLSAFLERVEDLCVARNVPKQILWEEAIDLFVGQARIWFRSMRRQIGSWDELVTEMRKEFQPSDYDEVLLAEIRTRTQGESERIGLYLSIMDNLFSRLTCQLDEGEQLKIVKKNLLPSFTEKLCLQDINSFDDLKSLCRRIEQSLNLVNKFRPPPSQRYSLEPDLAYHGVAKSKVKLAEVESRSINVRDTTSQRFNGKVICWDCREVGHVYRNCPRPRGQKFCWGCGQVDVIRSCCRKCSKKKGNGSGPRE